MADKRIQIKDKSGNKLYPAIDLSLSKNIGALNGGRINDGTITSSKLSGFVTVSKGGTGATTSSGARTNLGVYSKTEVDALIAGIDQFSYQVVSELPTASADTMFIIYLTASGSPTSGSYVEWLTIDKGASASPRYVWEKIGTTAADLSEYSKNTHTHNFTGSQGNISVSGTYSKATGVTIGTGTGTANYTPAGSVTITRATDVAVNTTTVNSITAVGSLPTLTTSTTSATGDISYVKGVTRSNTLGVTHTDPTFNTTDIYSITGVGSVPSLTYNATSNGGEAYIKSLSKGGYTPSGSVTATFKGNEQTKSVSITASGSVGLGSNTTSTNGVKYVEAISSTGASGTSNYLKFSPGTTPAASATFTGTAGSLNGSYTPAGSVTVTRSADVAVNTTTVNSITAVGNGSLTSDTTSTNGIVYVSDISNTGASVTASTSGSAITGINGGSGSLTTDTTSTNGIKYTESVDVSGLSISTTTSNGVTLTGSVKSGILTITATTNSSYLKTANISGSATVTTKYLHHSHTGASSSGSATFLKTVTVGGGTATATKKYLHHTHVAPTKGSDTTVATGIKTQPTFTGKFTGTAGSLSGSYTPAGTVTLNAGTAPSLTTSTATSTGAIDYIKSVSGGTTTATTKYFHPSFTGAASSGNITFTPSGSVTATFTGNNNTGVVTGGTTSYMHWSAGSVPTRSNVIKAFTSISTAGSVALTGDVTVTASKEYLKFNQGTLPTKGGNTTVATGIKTQPTFNSTFNGTGVNLTANVTNTATTINSTGTFTPTGSIGKVIDS